VNRAGMAVMSLAYTPDGQSLIAGSLAGTIDFWDSNATRRLHDRIKTSSLEVYGLAVSPNGKVLATAGSWQEIQIWDVATGRELLALKGHRGPVVAVAFSPDGKWLASGGYEQTIPGLGYSNWTIKHQITEGLDRITSLAFSPDGTTLVSGGVTCIKVRGNEYGAADKVRIWNVANGVLVKELTVRGSQVAFTSDGKSLLSVGLNALVEPVRTEAGVGIQIDGYTDIV